MELSQPNPVPPTNPAQPGPSPAATATPQPSPSATAQPAAPASPLESSTIEALRTIFDPEIPVNIYELGLVYGIQIDQGGAAKIRMTLTSPSCPEAESIPPRVQQAVSGVAGITSAEVEIVWEPPWHPGLMTEAARLELGLM